MDWKDGLTAAAVVGLGYVGIKSLTKSEDVAKDSLKAEEYLKPIWEKDDMRIVADYDHDFWYHDIEGQFPSLFDSQVKYEQFVNHVKEYGVYRLTLEKWNPEVGEGWTYVDGVGGNVPNPLKTLMDIAREQFSEFGDFHREWEN